MTVAADGDMFIPFLKKFFTVFACLVTRQLVRTEPIEIHGFHIRMALPADLGNLFFVRNSEVSRAGPFGEFFRRLRGIAPMTLVAKNALPGMDAVVHVFLDIGVT